MGRDLLGQLGYFRFYRFNPRARMGRDDRVIVDRSNNDGFNPRARMGRDFLRSNFHPYPLLFQSTRPHGARPN